jgi:uncharacterized membrane protein YphA (DoxX/SURF4 family)
MPGPLLWISAVALALTLLWAGSAKLVRWSAWRPSLEPYGIPGSLRPVVAVLVPAVEITIAMMIVVGPTRVAMALTLAMLAGFSLAVLRARASEGDRLPCGCFGGSEARDYRLMLVRNAFLGALAGAVLLSRTEDTVISSNDLPASSQILPALLVISGVLLVVWTLRQATSMMRRREHM